jgi:hypothetical protein
MYIYISFIIIIIMRWNSETYYLVSTMEYIVY